VLAEALKKRVINIFIANDLDLQSFAPAIEVNRLLSAIGSAKPFATNLRNSNLCDRHAEGIKNLIINNPRIMHLDIRDSALGFEVMQFINRIISYRPLFISLGCGRKKEDKYEVMNALNMPERKLMKQSSVCCCVSLNELNFE
jgi:hypothetical protein